MQTKSIRCKNCDALFVADVEHDIICPQCGKRYGIKKKPEPIHHTVSQDEKESNLQKKTIYCYNCGASIQSEAKFCPECGTQQKNYVRISDFNDTDSQSNPEKQKNKSTKWFFYVSIIYMVLVTVIAIFEYKQLLQETKDQIKEANGIISESTPEDSEKSNDSPALEANSGESKTEVSNNSQQSNIASMYNLELIKAEINYRDNEPYLIVTYNFTNNSDENRSFKNALTCKAFQNGIELGTVYTSYGLKSYSFESANKEIQPGKSLEVQDAYKLNDKKTEVEIQVQLFSVWTDKVYKTFIVTL